MGMYDILIDNKNNKQFQVKMFYDFGGLLKEYSVGDIIPRFKTDYDDEIVEEYDKDFNVFDLTLSDNVAIIRNGKLEEIVEYHKLYEEDCNFKCYDKYGRELDLKSINDYSKLRQKFL